MSRGRALGLVAAALLLSWLLPWGRIGCEPDLVLIAVVLAATARPPAEAVVAAVAIGLMQGALSYGVFGGRAAALALAAWIGGRMIADLSVESHRARVLLLACAVVAAGAIEWFLGRLAAMPPPAPGALVAAVATIAVGSLAWSTSAGRACARRRAR